MECGEMLTGNPVAKNSLENPTFISPKPFILFDLRSPFTQNFPAYSVTAMKLVRVNSYATSGSNSAVDKV
jgi:hypothetical protein